MKAHTLPAYLSGSAAAALFTVGGLVVSAGEPPEDVTRGYRDFYGDSVMVWEAEEADHWRPWHTVVWIDELETVDPAGNVIGFQVGDEPQRQLPNLAGAPAPRWTNFSYWAPIAAGGGPDPEPYLDAMLDGYTGDVVSVSEYNLTPVRLHVLAYFRRKALDLGVPYWQYLNAYSGWETDFTASHTRADLEWSAYTGQAFGYTGHWWFAYWIAPEGHEEATQGGGSILHTLGTWNRTAHYRDVAHINAGLRTFAEELHGGVVDWPSTDIRWAGDLVVGEFGPWFTMYVNNRHDATGDARPVTIDIATNRETVWPDGTVTDDREVTIPPGSAVVTRDRAAPLFATEARASIVKEAKP